MAAVLKTISVCYSASNVLIEAVALRPSPIARITVEVPNTMSPPAKHATWQANSCQLINTSVLNCYFLDVIVFIDYLKFL